MVVVNDAMVDRACAAFLFTMPPREAMRAALSAALAAEGVQAGEVEQRARELLAAEVFPQGGFGATLLLDTSIPQLGVVETDAALHAIEAALSQQPEARGAPLEPAGKPVGWWNGISNDWLGPEGSPPSIRWGADAEDSGHDIPLYSGYNPIHFAKPEVRGVVDDDALEALIGDADGARWSDDEFRIDGRGLMKLLRDAAALTGERNG